MEIASMCGNGGSRSGFRGVATGRTHRGYGVHSSRGAKLQGPEPASAGACLLAVAGVDCDRSHLLRSDVAFRAARALPARNSGFATWESGRRLVPADRRFYEAVLGQPRESQRTNGIEVLAEVFGAGTEAGAGAVPAF